MQSRRFSFMLHKVILGRTLISLQVVTRDLICSLKTDFGKAGANVL